MAMTYRLRAATHGVDADRRSVSRSRPTPRSPGCCCSTRTSPPASAAVRYHVDVESPAPAADVDAVLDEGDRLSPVLDVFTTAATRRAIRHDRDDADGRRLA